MFNARWAGTCQSCGGQFDQGDEVARTKDGTVHEGCRDDPAEPKRGEVCPECFTEKALSGVCAC